MKLLLSLLFFPSLVLASNGAIYDGYEEYYATFSERLFVDEKVELDLHVIDQDNNNYYSWRGTLKGRERFAEVKVSDNYNLSFIIDSHKFRAKQVKKFPGETISYNSLGFRTEAYFASDWACLKDTPLVRYRSIFLVHLPKGRKPQAWKLPGRFASCTGIRLQNGQIKFDKVEYRHQKDKDYPIGVSFHEYTIQGGRFIRTKSPSRSATFVEPHNVYKFTLDK
ncbi:MAG: hypothetical protein LBE22_04090 [Azoarcus sp.]|jgi:hypothetical protein|nr:hypothetical protein [Azoarcus sp.]